MGEVGSGENWKCFLCFVSRVLMFALFGSLECQEKKPASQSWEKTQNRKNHAKISILPIWRALLKEKLWNVVYLSAWRMNWVTSISMSMGQTEHHLPTPLIGAELLFLGKWTVMAAQQGPSYVFPQFKHRHKPKGRDSLSDAFLKKEKKIEIKWTIWKILCLLQR